MKFLLLLSEEKGVTYVCLRCVVSSPGAVRSSPMLVGNNKVVEDEVGRKVLLWIVFFFVLQFRMCQITSSSPFYSGVNATQMIFRHTNELRDFSLTTHKNESFYLQLWGGLFLALQNSWYLGLWVFWRRDSLAGCWKWQRVVGRVREVFKATV